MKRVPENADVYGQFYLKDAQAVFLPIGGVRPAKPLEKAGIELPLKKEAWVIYAEEDRGLD